MNNGPHSWRCWGLNEARAEAVQRRMRVVVVGVEVVLVVAVGAAAVPVSGR